VADARLQRKIQSYTINSVYILLTDMLHGLTFIIHLSAASNIFSTTACVPCYEVILNYYEHQQIH